MNKNIFGLILAALLLLAGFAYFKTDLVKNLQQKPVSQVTVSAVNPNDDYIEVKSTTTADKVATTTVRKIVWEGLGFEPGFAFKIFSETENGKDIITSNIITQDGEVFSGFLTATGSADTLLYSATMTDINTTVDKEIQISFKEKACTKPSGEDAKYSTTIKVGAKTMTGCADAFNQ